MTVDSALLWKNFLLEHKNEYNSFDYDLKVGEGTEPPSAFEESLRYDFIELSKKRIDVVGYKDDVITLFEIKPRAGLSAVGQLLGYKQLFESTYPSLKVSHLICITAFLNMDEQKVYDQNGIKCFVYAFI